MEKLFWSLYSRCYDTICKLYPYKRMLDDIIKMLPSENGLCILDVGCGTGNLENLLLYRRPDLKITAIDNSDSMLRVAMNKKLENSTFLYGDLTSDSSGEWLHKKFDVVVCINVIYIVDDPKSVVTRLKTCVNNGGVLIISTPKNKPSIGSILRDHVRHSGFLSLIRVLVPLVLVGLLNLIIVKKGQIGKYHFFDMEQICQLTNAKNIFSTYADQNWLVEWKKEILRGAK